MNTYSKTKVTFN